MSLLKLIFYTTCGCLFVYFYTKGMIVPFNWVLYFLWIPGFAYEMARVFEKKRPSQGLGAKNK